MSVPIEIAIGSGESQRFGDWSLSPMSTTGRTATIFTYVTVLLPAFGAICAALLAAFDGVRVLDVGLLVSMYCATMLGITMGYHRLLAHRSFETNKWGRAALAILGSMAAQGPLLYWVAVHRRHHQRSDQPGDPHSPVANGKHRGASARGFWHAHLGWMFEDHNLNFRKLVPELMKDRTLMTIDRAYPIWALMGLLIPTLIGGIVTGSLPGAGHGFLWGGLLRVFAAHHATWSINSICHVVGTRPFATPDLSRNNFALALLTFGEGWHNNHHAFPAAAQHGIRWWQLDIVYYIVCFLEGLGIVRSVRTRPLETPKPRQALSLPNQN